MWPWAATPPPHFLSFFPSPISSLYHLQAGLISYSQSKKSLRYPCKIFISKGVAFPTWLFLTFLLDLHHMLPYLNFKSLKEADPTAFNNSISWAGYNSHNIVNQLHLGLKKKHFFFFLIGQVTFVGLTFYTWENQRWEVEYNGEDLGFGIKLPQPCSTTHILPLISCGTWGGFCNL